MVHLYRLARTSTALLALGLGLTLASARAATPMLVGNIDHPLRYQPDGTDFVIVNGGEYFNRPLYSANSPFRVDGGDKPEFSLYQNGHQGNLRLGISVPGGARWLNDTAQITTRYRPGSLIYEISDPLLGQGATLTVTILPLYIQQGFIVRAELSPGALAVNLIWAFGGASGERGSRNGDIGTEAVPISSYFQFKPENATDNEFTVASNTFTLRHQMTTIWGIAPTGSRLTIANASAWVTPANLLARVVGTPDLPVVAGQAQLTSAVPVYLALAQAASPEETLPTALAYNNLPQLFADTENHRRDVAQKVVAETPDPFINAAVAALCVAADAIWDESEGVFMHGAVAWRSKILGWRGAYAGDDLGWTDRENRHLLYWAIQQNTTPVNPGPAAPDPKVNYARDEQALHTNGDLSDSHYDMNLAYMDALLRHLLWTGDLDLARNIWPVIQRHLDWEKRLFRRPFGPDYAPLYEGYADIWASDDLEYGGGAATEASAYNYFDNLMAARVATLIGEDPKPYQDEASLIQHTMHNYLWIQPGGWFAEYKDVLGQGLAHPDAALWSYYLPVDSRVVSPQEAWQLMSVVDTQLPHLPVRGPGIVDDGYYMLSTTNWMPYTWSLNNVVVAENAHAALAFWETGRNADAFRLLKGTLLDGMYRGLTPGNVGMTTELDAGRGEVQRDFGDAIGILSRTVVEGLFGVRPDALAGEVIVRPGFPAEWDHASLHHPDFDFSYQLVGPVKITSVVKNVIDSGSPHSSTMLERGTVVTEGLKETYSYESRFAKPLALRLQIVARRDQIAEVTVNGFPAKFSTVEDAIETPRIEILCAPAPKDEISITWSGKPIETLSAPAVVALGGDIRVPLGLPHVLQITDPQGVWNDANVSKDAISGIAMGAPGNHVVFVQVQQNEMRWWAPLSFESRPAFEFLPADHQDAGHLRFTVRNNTPKAFDQDVAVQTSGKSFPVRLTAPAMGESAPIVLDAAGLLPGSNEVGIGLGNNAVLHGVVTNWNHVADASSSHFEPINLTAYFNDKVTQIFKNTYNQFHSPFPSLSIPTQGIGSWVNWQATAEVDDSGLRAAAARSNGRITLPLGVPFLTPGAADQKNIVFTSQWKNYPATAVVPINGRAAHVYLLMAGSTNPMQSGFDNGEVFVTYIDGSTVRLPLQNPTTWWPIDQDYFTDDYAFHLAGPLPLRVDLKTGLVRNLAAADFKGQGGKIPGGAATVLDLSLDPGKDLKSLTVHTLANEVVIGLMAVTLAR